MIIWDDFPEETEKAKSLKQDGGVLMMRKRILALLMGLAVLTAFSALPAARAAGDRLEITSINKIEDEDTQEEEVSLEITSLTMIENGYLSVKWTDTGADSYDVYWVQSSSAGNLEHMGTFTATRADISYIPGVNCEIAVMDSKNNYASKAFHPGEAPAFQDGKWTSGIKKLTLKPRKALDSGKYKDYAAFPADEMKGLTEEWGLYISFQCPSLATTRDFHELMTVTDPYGDVTILHDRIEEYGKSSHGSYYKYYYNLYSLTWYFKWLTSRYDEIIPRGEYTWSLYWDGMYVNSATFSVK